METNSRVFKKNSVDFTPFYRSVTDLADSSGNSDVEANAAKKLERRPPIDTPEAISRDEGVNLLEKYSYLFQTFISFEKKTQEIHDADEIFELFKDAIRRVIPVKQASLLYFNDDKSKLIPLEIEAPDDLVETMNEYEKEGVLDLIFDGNRAIILPHMSSFNAEGQKMKYLLLPVFEDGDKKGVLVVLTTAGDNMIRESDKQFLDVVLRVYLSKIERLRVKDKLNKLYEELQTYQAKLSNDFRLAAIGELTQGIVEDIVSPLQVIMSLVDLMENGDENAQEIKKIKSQINKINSVISRLVKFASLNQKNVKIQSLNVNEVIKEYHTLVKSSLDSLKLEVVLDFEKDIPPILSHPNYIHQILANVFGLIKTFKKDEVGVLIQTRHSNDTIHMKIVSTADLGNPASKVKSSKLTLKIIDNLMKKHEGGMKIETFKSGGSQILLRFPLKRKIKV
jgi:K+-sensing histidine kinase KdpD